MSSRYAVALLSIGFSLGSALSFSQSTESKQRLIESHAQKAQEFVREKRPDLAIPELKSLVKLDPQNVDAQGNLGVLLFFRGDYAHAIPHLRAAVTSQPALTKIQALLGMAEERVGHDNDGRKDLEAAFPHLQEEKLKIEVGNDLINSYTSTGDLDKAAATVAILLKLQPTNTDLLYTAYRLNSDLADEAMLTMAMTSPNSAQMHQVMARVLSKEGDPTAAIANYREAIRLDPKLAELHFELAELLNTSGTDAGKKEAVAEYQAALALNPADEKSDCELGRIADHNGDNQAALTYYSRAAKLQPDDAAALTGLAKVLIATQQPDKALLLLEHAAQLDPTSEMTHFRISTLYRRTGRDADAKRELNEYLKYKKMKAQLADVFKQMRLSPAKNSAGDSDAVR